MLSFKNYFQPGLYAIINTKLEKYYIGEANNVADRLSDQFIQLNLKRNDCKELQKDWEIYGQEAFDFVILELGTDPWSDRVKRLGAERHYIDQYKNVYNILGKTEIKKPSINPGVNSNTNSIPIIIKDELFTSVNKAAKLLNVSISTIRNKLNNPKFPDYKYADPERRSATNLARAMVVDKKYYNSISIAAAEIGLSEKTIRKNIKEKPDWNYFDLLTNQEKKLILPDFDENKQREGEFSQGRKIKVGDKEYSSIRQAAISYNINSSSVRKRIKSPNFPEWEWFDS